MPIKAASRLVFESPPLPPIFEKLLAELRRADQSPSDVGAPASRAAGPKIRASRLETEFGHGVWR